MMDNGVKEKLFDHLEMEEGVTPTEYDGTDVNFPVFDATKQYGLWITLKEFDTNYRVMKMFEAMGCFIPMDLSMFVHVIHRFGKTEGGEVVQSIGWKYTPIVTEDRPSQPQAHNF